MDRFDAAIRQMRRHDPQVAEDGFDYLRRHAADHVGRLIAEFEAERKDIGVKRWLLELIGDARSGAALPLLVAQLGAADHGVRENAARGLRMLDTAQARRALWESHRDEPLEPAAESAEVHAFRLLRGLDDPECGETPRGYDHAAVRARFERLAARLDRDFGCQCLVDRGVQDASFHGEIVVPDAATESGEIITVRISNFGTLAVYTPENLGCYRDEEKLIALGERDYRRVVTALADSGYDTVPEDVLHEPYDGNLAHMVRDGATWFTRYFDYL